MKPMVPDGFISRPRHQLPMASGEDDSQNNNDGEVLSPEELDITEEDSVVELDDGRFVISPDSRPNVPGAGDDVPTDPQTDPDSPQESPQEGDAAISQESVHQYLRDQMAEAEASYGFDVTATFDGSVAQQELYSDDIVTTFEGLLVWYAQHAGGTTPIEEVLGILLMEANIPIRYPSATLKALISSLDVEPSDSVSDLLAAIDETETIHFPPDS